MTEITPYLPFVICKSCVKGFDVDHNDNSTRNTRISWRQYNGPNTEEADIMDMCIYAECPHCFADHSYTWNSDYFWPHSSTIEEKKNEILISEHVALRKKMGEQGDKITLLERDNQRLRRQVAFFRGRLRKLADAVHLANPKAPEDSLETEPNRRYLPYS